MLTLIDVIAGLIVLAEATNKLHRCDVWGRRHDGARAVLVEALKVAAWFLLALGAGGAVAQPLLQLPAPGIVEVCTMLGFAVLIVRTRLKENSPGATPAQSDDFEQTLRVDVAELRRRDPKLAALLVTSEGAAKDVADAIGGEGGR